MIFCIYANVSILLSTSLIISPFLGKKNQNSESSASSRQICYLVKKAENKWWDRLLKQGGKSPSFLKVDWDKWIDEDEVNEQDAKR